MSMQCYLPVARRKYILEFIPMLVYFTFSSIKDVRLTRGRVFRITQKSRHLPYSTAFTGLLLYGVQNYQKTMITKMSTFGI